MVQKLKGARFALFVAALFSTNFIIMTDFVIFPIVDALYAQFPDQVAGVNFIISGPSLIIVFASLLVPQVLRRVNRKVLLLVGCAAFAVTSIGGCLVPSVPYMIACRIVGGVTYAIAQVCAISIISDYWVDEDKRATMVGFYNMAQAGAGALMSFVAGNLAVGGWTNAYQTYWIAVPVFLLILFFVPNMEVQQKDAADGGAASSAVEGASQGMGSSFWMMVTCFTCLTVCYMFIVTFASVYVAENGLGDSALAGSLSSLVAVGSATMCALFGLVFRKLKRGTSIPFYFIMAACILVMKLAPGVPSAMACCTLVGGCFGSVFSYAYAMGSMMVPPLQVDRATGIVTAAYGLGVFVTTYFATFLMGIMGTDRITDVLFVPVAILAVVGAVEAVRVMRDGKAVA